MVGIGNNSSANRKALYFAEIAKAKEARKAKHMGEALSPGELGALTSSDRIIALLKHGVLDNFRIIYAANPQMDVLPGVVMFVSIFSDTGGGRCSHPITKMAKFFSRSDNARL